MSHLELVSSDQTIARTTDEVAERKLLSAVLSGHPLAADQLARVSGADFYQPKHEAIWNACIAVDAEGRKVDPSTLKLPPAALPVLADLMLADSHGALANAYAEKVVEAAQRRRMVAASQKIRQLAETAVDMGAAIQEARSTVEEAAGNVVDDDAGMDANELLTETIDELENPTRDPGILSGWPDLDDFIGGMRPGQVTVVGARPKHGKTVVACNIAAAACKAGIGVHFASLEMTRTEVMSRMLSAVARVDLKRLMDRNLSEADWQRVNTAHGVISQWNLRTDEQAGQTLNQIRARARNTSRRWPLGLIVVDYLQLMGGDRRLPREQLVGGNSEGMKVLAKDLGVPVLLLSQLNRGVTDRKESRPMMSDLRESGRIEQDADRILLLHREDMVDPKSATGELEVHVAANRHGPSGRTVTLQFQGHYARAVSKAQGSHPPDWSPTSALEGRS